MLFAIYAVYTVSNGNAALKTQQAVTTTLKSDSAGELTTLLPNPHSAEDG